MIPATARRGREFIIVDEWGSHDWQTPKLGPWRARRITASPSRAGSECRARLQPGRLTLQSDSRRIRRGEIGRFRAS
jgi:hypothetical protein